MTCPQLARRTIRGASVEVHVLDVLHQIVDHRLVVKGLPRLTYHAEVGVCLGTARHEERAAVRSRLRADVIRADLLGSIDDLNLVRANERAENRNLGDVIRGSDVLEGLRGDLAKRLARDQSLRTLKLRHALRDLKHETAIHDDAERLRRLKRNLALALAKGHHIEAPDDTGARTISCVSHSDSSLVIGRPEKCTGTQIAPRRPTIHVATGESKPLESNVTTLPAVPTGRPPAPR